MTQPRERKTAVGYVRVSTDDQVGHISLHSQEKGIQEWCDREGFDLVAMFRDEGAPAYANDINRRPGLAALLEELPRLRPDTVVVYSLDRWARSKYVAAGSFRMLASLNIGLASITEAQHGLSPTVISMLSMMASFEEYYRSYRSKRSSRKHHPSDPPGAVSR